MEFGKSKLDWSQVQAFLAVAETGSLSAAARHLGLTQPTVGRQIAAVEADLDVNLFLRRPRGMEPTEAALALLDAARRMRDAAGQLELTAAGVAAGEGGTVRVTASVFMAHHVMPAIFTQLRREAPDIALELVASDTSENLLYREADIAVRMVRPRQLDVVTRFVGEIGLGLFGQKDYLDRLGRPETEADLERFDFVGYDRDEEIIQGFRKAGYQIDRTFFATRCDMQTCYWELVRAGCGLGFGQLRHGRADPELEELAVQFPVPALPVWLAAPEAIRHAPPVRRVWTVLEQALSQVVDRQSMSES